MQAVQLQPLDLLVLVHATLLPVQQVNFQQSVEVEPVHLVLKGIHQPLARLVAT